MIDGWCVMRIIQLNGQVHAGNPGIGSRLFFTAAPPLYVSEGSTTLRPEAQSLDVRPVWRPSRGVLGVVGTASSRVQSFVVLASLGQSRIARSAIHAIPAS